MKITDFISREIPGSPFSLNVLPGPASFETSIVVLPAAALQAGSDLDFSFTIKDQFRNDLDVDAAELEISLRDLSSGEVVGGLHLDVEVTGGADVTAVVHGVQVAGSYVVDVLYDGQPLLVGWVHVGGCRKRSRCCLLVRWFAIEAWCKAQTISACYRPLRAGRVDRSLSRRIYGHCLQVVLHAGGSTGSGCCLFARGAW